MFTIGGDVDGQFRGKLRHASSSEFPILGLRLPIRFEGDSILVSGSNLDNEIADSMKFSVFGPENRAKFDEQTLEFLDQLHAKFGEVEFRSISKNEKCVRIVTEIGYLPTPLATLGATFRQAAQRLVAVTAGINEEPPAL